MTTMTKNEIFEEYKNEYWQVSVERKGQILTVVCEVTKMHRKAAIRRFAYLQRKDPSKEEARGRAVYYTPDVTAALKGEMGSGGKWGQGNGVRYLFSAFPSRARLPVNEKYRSSDSTTSFPHKACCD